MLKHIVHSKALHNRKTFEIKLPPLPASEARLFFKNLRSDFEIARFLMVFGDIPKYLEQLDPRLPFSDNVERIIRSMILKLWYLSIENLTVCRDL